MLGVKSLNISNMCVIIKSSSYITSIVHGLNFDRNNVDSRFMLMSEMICLLCMTKKIYGMCMRLRI